VLERPFLSPPVGDRPPPCFGMSPNRTFYSFEEQYGRPSVLVLLGAASQSARVVGSFVAQSNSFAARGADVLLIVDDNPKQLFGGALTSIPIRTIDCGNFLSRCGVAPRDTMLLVLDRNLRVAARFSPDQERDPAAACLASLDALPHEPPTEVSTPAPVIVLPNLLPHALCRYLIGRFEDSATIDGAVARIDAAGNVCSVVDHQKKHRRDLIIEPDTDLHQTLRDALLDRCAPEIAKAFQKRVSYLDRILLSRYDDTGGWFHRHRDNTARNVAFREFALSVNLNTGEYEGGHLLFPEYNDHRYCPPAGAGVIFSTAILHAAAPVTAGHRYVLLTFLHGEAAEARRLARIARMDAA
jgi:predicted 2-oxoglutarate/Fe(II)-dependent dioxygenase YbiX